MSDINAIPFDDETDDDAFAIITPAMVMPTRRLTIKRLSWLFDFTDHVSIQGFIDDASGKVFFAISLPTAIFNEMTDAELAEMASIFRGLKDVSYHPRLQYVLTRSLH